MTLDSTFTDEQLEYLELWHIAAKYDCLYILDFHCANLFDHDRVLQLSDRQRADLAQSAQKDVFEHAIKRGYRPVPFNTQGKPNGYLC